MSDIRFIIATKGEERHVFPSIIAAAEFTGVSKSAISVASKWGNTQPGGWTFTKGERVIAHESRPVIAVTPLGVVGFSGIHEAAELLETTDERILKCIRNNINHVRGWKFRFDYGLFDTVPLTEEVKATLLDPGARRSTRACDRTPVVKVERQKVKVSVRDAVRMYEEAKGIAPPKPKKELPVFIPLSQRVRNVPRREEEVCVIERRTPIATGVYDPDYGVTICPICGKVCSNTAGGNDWKHVQKCLSGHDWSYNLGIIEVYD